MSGKLNLVIVLIAAFAALGIVNADFMSVYKNIKDIVDAIPGMKHAGASDRGKGCKINWSYEGMLMGVKWKYMGLCTDSCTGETMTVFMESKGGAVDHCFKDLMQKLRERNEM